MTNHQGAVNQGQKPIEGYRGALIYRQEYGYMLITMMIDLRTPDERSNVTPDVITIGKAFGAGFPISGVIAKGEIAQSKPWANPSGSSSSYG